MSKVLRIELLPEERRELSDSFTTVVAISFGVADDGAINIVEHWDDFEELWGAGVRIRIPSRVWQVGLKWLAGEGRHE